ncbi:MAG: PilN domain-containing protein [Pseudomonadota bacterium]|nr:PilN domain-containing protein [Pseudomonadota bacterium]
MIRINLLPWREQRRKQREQAFYMMLGGSVLAAVLVSLLAWMWLNGQISGQHERNAFLDQEIKKVEEQITDIESLKQKKAALLNRKQVIEELQANRYQMVHLFDSLMRTVPDGLVLTSLKQDGEQLTLEGRAQSNSRVATYMRNLESSGWMSRPDVTVIEAATPQSQPAASSAGASAAALAQLPYLFTLRVTLATPENPPDPNAAPSPDPVPVAAATIAPLDAPAANAAASADAVAPAAEKQGEGE